MINYIVMMRDQVHPSEFNVNISNIKVHIYLSEKRSFINRWGWCQVGLPSPRTMPRYARQRHMMDINRGHTDISYISFSNVGPRVWNALLNKINVNVPISQFK